MNTNTPVSLSQFGTIIIVCHVCRIRYAVSRPAHDLKRESMRPIYCPNGHEGYIPPRPGAGAKKMPASPPARPAPIAKPAMSADAMIADVDAQDIVNISDHAIEDSQDPMSNETAMEELYAGDEPDERRDDILANDAANEELLRADHDEESSPLPSAIRRLDQEIGSAGEHNSLLIDDGGAGDDVLDEGIQ